MISKYLFCFFTLYLTINFTLKCQINNNNIRFDVDHFPVFRFDTLETSLNISYYIITEKKAICNVQFNGGFEALNAFCDSLYFNRSNSNQDELNAMAEYIILFDKKLRIKDIRILKRLAYDNSKYNYDKLIINILLATKGKWVKKDNKISTDLYFYLGRFRVR